MESNIPEEIQDKIKFIEKEANKRRWPNNKWELCYMLLGILLAIVIILMISFLTSRTGHYAITIFVLAFSLAGNSIARYFEYSKLSKLYANACEVIDYYKNKETK
jgi:uncharacterized membrane protein